MEIVSQVALISINETLVVQLVSFLIFLFIINRIMFRPLRGVMGEREKYLSTVQSDIVSAEEELDKANRLLKDHEAATRSQAYEMQQELEEQGGQQAAQIFADVRKEVAELKERTEDEVDAKIAEARKHLREESQALAVKIMEKILDRGVA
jgi:F-type H+-transporting ATPase subunit b